MTTADEQGMEQKGFFLFKMKKKTLKMKKRERVNVFWADYIYESLL